MGLFEVEILIPGNEPDGRPIRERVYATGDTQDEALAKVRAEEGVKTAEIVRELSDEEKRAFRFLPSAAF